MSWQRLAASHTRFSTDLDFCVSLLVGHQPILPYLRKTSPYLDTNVYLAHRYLRKLKWIQCQRQLNQVGLSYLFHANFTDLSLYLDHIRLRLSMKPLLSRKFEVSAQRKFQRTVCQKVKSQYYYSTILAFWYSHLVRNFIVYTNRLLLANNNNTFLSPETTRLTITSLSAFLLDTSIILWQM